MEEQNGLPLLELRTAYQSLRESGFDFSTAIGELIDNSVQAKAKRIDVIPKIVKKKPKGKKKPVSVITQVSVVDDGEGMDEETLNGCPQLGFSTRFNDRDGLGRFGVGATYASISQCKRTIFCSRSKGIGNFLATYIDLDEISENIQTDIPKPSESHLPEDLEDMHFDHSSTIVVWDKCDRLRSDANGNPIEADELLGELKNWVSRAYRYVIWSGVEIYIKDKKICAYDPLYLNTDQSEFPSDPCATERFSGSFDWPIPNSAGKTSSISVKLALLPEEWRRVQGDGGRPHARERRIPENEGLSVLRHHREVAFGNFYPIVPKQEEIDRWWGCEINFEPELDECWEIKNIKRGARPTEELREKLKEILAPKIRELRKEIQNHWKTGIPTNIFRNIRQIALSLIKKNGSVTATDVQGLLSGQTISIDDISQVLEDLAIENRWDWTTDGTQRSYSPLSSERLSELESEREMCFKDLRCAIEDSNIEQKFKDVALFDLEQAKASYEARAFKASIVMFGAIAEGLMLGVIRTNTVLEPMMINPQGAPRPIRKLGIGEFSQPEELANEISEKLKFEDYKNIIDDLKSDIERLEIQRIQNLRNTIHPWESIKRPQRFRDPGPTIAINCLSSLSLLAKKILA